MNGKRLSFRWIWLMVAVLLTACETMSVDEQDQATDQVSGKNVVIRVTGVDAGWGGSSTRALVQISEVCSRVCFAVYQNGSRVKYENQKAGDSDFGTFAMKLDAGIYQLLVMGHSGAANPATTNPEKLQFTNPTASNGTGFTDTFYYYGALVVGENSTQVSIEMKRATAMFRLKMTDAKPVDVKQIQFYYEGGSGSLDATTGLGCVKSKQSVVVNVGDNTPLQFEIFTFPRSEVGEMTVTVKAFDASGNLIREREFANVKIQRNCITQYSGLFFTGDVTPDDPSTPDPSNPSSNVVMVDPEWGQVLEYTY